MRVLVTGASGFIGSHLAERLEQRGDEVFCLVRQRSNVSFLKTLNVKLLYGNLEDRNSLKNAVMDKDIIYHPAGLIKSRHRADFFKVNQGGTKNLLEAVVAAGARPKRFVYFSSQAACGSSPDDKPLTEASPCKPITAYGKSKLAGEEEVRKICHANNLPYTIIRPTSVFGPRDKEILFFFRQAKKGKIPVIGKYEKLFSLVYVKDLVEGTILAAESRRSIGETYFIAYPQPLDWHQTAHLLGKTLGVNCHLKYFPYCLAYLYAWANEIYAYLSGKDTIISRSKVLELAQLNLVCSVEKIRAHLGFAPRSNIEDALCETAEWYKSQGWL